jgi:cyanophycinase
MEEKVTGNLIIIGGAEDKEGKKTILKHVADIVQQQQGSLVVLTTATEKPEEVGNNYRMVFESLGLNNIQVLNINTRDEANDERNTDVIRTCSGVFFTGGDQLRITSILGGTKTNMALQEVYSQDKLLLQYLHQCLYPT